MSWMPLLVWWATDVCMNGNCFSSQLPSIDLRTDALYTFRGYHPHPFPFPQLSHPFPPHPIVVCSVDTQTPSSRHSPTEYLILSADPVKTEIELTNQVSESWWKHSGWKRLWGTSVNAKCVGPLQRSASTMEQSLATNARHSSGQNKFVIFGLYSNFCLSLGTHAYLGT